MSADVRLVRVVNSRRDCNGCGVKDDYTVAVSFEDADGQVVSLAFDGRPAVEDNWGAMSRLAYGAYFDNPVWAGRDDLTNCADPVLIMRALRDGLNNLNLGD